MIQKKTSKNNHIQEAKRALDARFSEITGLFEYHMTMFKKYKREISQIEKKLALLNQELTHQKGD